MKEQELELIRDYIDGRLDASKVDELNQLLENNAEARTAFRHLSLMEEGLQDWSNQTFIDDNPFVKASTITKTKPKRQSVYSSAVAGLLVGVFSTIFVNAYLVASPQINDFISLCFESFETEPPPAVEGMPYVIGQWGGDYSHVVSIENDIKPFHGKRMLSFLRADYKGKKEANSYIGDLYRFIDLGEHLEKIKANRSKVELIVRVNNLAYSDQQNFQASTTIVAFDKLPGVQGAPESSSPQLDPIDVDTKGLAIAKRNMPLEKSGKKWQDIKCELILPSESKYLLIRISIADSKQYKIKGHLEFKGNYIDSIEVNLSEIPLLSYK